jgi:hypothetical protein
MNKVLKMVTAVARAGDDNLVVNDGQNKTVAETYLRVGWRIVAVLPAIGSSNEVRFILEADSQ